MEILHIDIIQCERLDVHLNQGEVVRYHDFSYLRTQVRIGTDK